MDANKICFIVCTNDSMYMEECAFYINMLKVPEGYTINLLSITDAKSMTSGYNEGMNHTDAKYKIYLHQDVFLVNPDFIEKLLSIFTDKTIGMVGMVGSKTMPWHGIMWYGERAGKLYSSNVVEAGIRGFEVEGQQDVEAVDGMLIATQYDLPWREDLFTGWDFYDVSQSYEFRKAGYRIVVPDMEKPWCIHDDGFLNLANYHKERHKFLAEYSGEQMEP